MSYLLVQTEPPPPRQPHNPFFIFHCYHCKALFVARDAYTKPPAQCAVCKR